jgi:hypothetical protein
VFDTVQGCIYNIDKASFSPDLTENSIPHFLLTDSDLTKAVGHLLTSPSLPTCLHVTICLMVSDIKGGT